jgi:hypothetical protein
MDNIEEKIQDLTSAAIGPTLDIITDTLIDGVAGAVIPGVGNMILSYKQNRMERRVAETLQKLVERQDELNEAIERLSEDMGEQIKGTYFEMLLDYSIGEPQEEKVEYLVNGYINIAKAGYAQEDVVRSFYDTLAQLNMLDLRVFKLYAHANDDNYYKILEDYQIEDSHYRMVQEKLVRLGLIYSKIESQREENADAVLSYLMDLEKGRKAKLKAKKVTRNYLYGMSRYGYRFIKFIERKYQEQGDVK